MKVLIYQRLYKLKCIIYMNILKNNLFLYITLHKIARLELLLIASKMKRNGNIPEKEKTSYKLNMSV
jgi:hypothetical protein